MTICQGKEELKKTGKGALGLFEHKQEPYSLPSFKHRVRVNLLKKIVNENLNNRCTYTNLRLHIDIYPIDPESNTPHPSFNIHRRAKDLQAM